MKGRIGMDLEHDSVGLMAKMLPDVEKDEGGEVDLIGDGQHKIYLHRGQMLVYNFGSRTTRIRAARGFGKTTYIGVHIIKTMLGLPRQMGGFVGASAKQILCRTAPNALKTVRMMGFESAFFMGQAPAKLKWPMPLAKPRNWENVIHFQNGYCLQLLSMAVRGSANGLNLASIIGDETKYLPWQRVKEEVLPTLRGDFLPPEYQKYELKRWGYGTDPHMNPYWLSQLWVSDAGLTNRECLWEKEEDYQTRDVNSQIVEMLAELKYLEKKSPRNAVALAQNENFLRRLHLLRSQSETFWNFSSIENAAMLGGEAWIRQMKRELPDLMFRIQILGQRKGNARDGFYANFDIEIHGYQCNDLQTYSLIADKYTEKKKGEVLDGQRWPTKYETECIDLDQAQAGGEDCSLDIDVDYTSPLLIAIDANANLNCMVVGQSRMFEGRESLVVLKSFFVMNERKLRALCKDFTDYYKPFLRRKGEVIFYFTATIKQGASYAYAVEDAEKNRFDRVVEDELSSMGWKVTPVDMGAPFKHQSKFQVINDCLSFVQKPAIRINNEAGRNDYLITAIENAGVDSATFKKDKSREKLTSEDGIGGDPRSRTDVTDAFDDLLIGVKYKGTSRQRLGRGLAFQGIHIPGLGGIVG